MRAVVVMLALLLGACTLTREVHDLNQLRSGEPVLVSLADGRQLEGRFERIDDEKLYTSVGAVPLSEVAQVESRKGPDAEQTQGWGELFQKGVLVAIGVIGLALLL
ncbi:hypothetical protein [Gallaecimonas pentaromativorans]|uniref:Uncharacterized protein n=1 Tax=Gallaecimonas pentaromativorans TaxID=584787 RepID=A0A3N1NX45_9GAMM|nr:hypothetical protein [Gallaecimonas pentaromativorans]ROQ24404.1 hypothetical protein EDC28_107287 [Gallaecimonas pentaromativorans]